MIAVTFMVDGESRSFGNRSYRQSIRNGFA